MQRMIKESAVVMAVTLAAALVAVYAQPVTTTITDTVYNAVTGSPFSGTVVIQGPNITAPGNIPILGISRTINISNGALSIALVPNDTGTPSSTYSMKFSNGDSKTCTVPTSPTPITLAAAGCVDGSQQTVPAVVALSQIASGGATAGQSLCFTGNTWTAGYCPARVATPSSSSAACSIGQFAFDSNFSYWCVAANTWRRSAISTW